MEERQKTLESNERKTARETCKMKKATCGQFRVYERNFTCTVVTSPWPNALAALSCEHRVLNPSPRDQCGPGHAGPPNACPTSSQQQHWHEQRWFVELKKQTEAQFLMHWSHLGPRAAFLFLLLQLQREQWSPVGPDLAQGLRHTRGPGSRRFLRCITQPLESSDFTTTAHHLLLKGTFLLRSDKSSLNVRHSPLSPRRRPQNIATHQVLLSFVWSIMTWQNQKQVWTNNTHLNSKYRTRCFF